MGLSPRADAAPAQPSGKLEDSDPKRECAPTAYVLEEHPDDDDENADLDPALNQRLLRLQDLCVSLPVGLLFLTSFLDRSSLGNAYTAGMGTDLHFPPNGLNIATTIFYPTYVIFEPISTIVFRRIGARYMLSFVCVGWGLITLFTGFCSGPRGYHAFLACRVLLGLVESSFFPCCALYLTYFYRREELGLRTSYLFVAAALSGGCSGLLASAIFCMDGIGGKAGWSWFFIILGIITVVLGASMFFVLADSPETAWFIRDPELRATATKRSRIINQYGASGAGHAVNWAEIKEGLKDPKLWIGSISQFGADTMLFSVATFMVLIIKKIQPGRSTVVIQLLTVPVYFFGAAVYILSAALTDRYGHRHATMVGIALITVIGYAILLGCDKPGALYFATFLTVNCYSFVGINVSLQNTNQAGSSKRAIGSGLQLAIGNAGGIVAGQLYPSNKPYTMGYSVSIGLTCFSAVLYLINWAYMAGMNRARDRLQTQMDEGTKDSTASVPEASADSPDYPHRWCSIGPGLRSIPGDRTLSFRYNL